MGLLDERSVPMHGYDHTTIAKFEGESSKGYKMILDALKEYAEEAKEG